MTHYQISSGQGPAECELGVAKFLAYLQRHYDIEMLGSSTGYYPGTYRSVHIACAADLSAYTGSIQWVCRSPYRPTHKRKNWFLDFRICQDTAAVKADFNANRILFSPFHCGGKGGQNVNKVASGVRAVYPPTGHVVECTEERSQHANKQKAIARLREQVTSLQNQQQADAKNSNWRSHTDLRRGDAKKIFYGLDFT